MGRWEAKYTADQRDALVRAYTVEKLTGPEAVAAAAAGTLQLRGKRIPAFETNADYVRDCARKVKARRTGKHVGELAQLPARDAIEALRQRLVNVAEAMVTDLETLKPNDIDPERFRQIVRCVREAQHIAGRKETPPPPPGTRRNGTRVDAETKGGIAGGILADIRREHSGNATAHSNHIGEAQGNNTNAETTTTRPTPPTTDNTKNEPTRGASLAQLAERLGLGGVDSGAV